MKLNLKFPGQTVTATLFDTPTARDFAELLPLTLTLEDYNQTEKISDLPRKLTKQGSPPGAAHPAGDLAYYAPWGNLALFYNDFRYSDGLILLGKMDGDGVKTLRAAAPMNVEIERYADQ